MLNRIQLQNAHEKIYGYFMPMASEEIKGKEGMRSAFERAKSELIKNLEAQIEEIKTFNFEDWNCKGKKY